MRSKFAILGLPLHPSLAAVGAGLFAWALAANIAFQARAPEMTFYHVTYWTTIAAFAAGSVAFLVWLGDYLTIARKSDYFAMATAYTGLRLGTLLTFLAALLLFVVPGAASGAEKIAIIVLEAVGVGLQPLAWWMCNEMIYKHHLGMVPDTPDEAIAEQERHAPHPGGSMLGQH